MIQRILNNLSDNQREQLMYAFEQGFAQYLELDDSKFIGVYINHLSYLQILESEGDFSYGIIQKEVANV